MVQLVQNYRASSFKRGAVLFAFGSSLAGQAHSQNYVDTVLATNPVAYWRNDAVNENDIVNGYSTTYNGTATATGPGGGILMADYPNNAALSLDGGGYVSTGLTSQQQFGSGCTMMAWFNLAELPSTAGRDMVICGKSHYGNDLDLQIETDNELRFYTEAGAHSTYTTPLVTNQWYQVAAEFDNATNTRQIFINGNLVASDTMGTHYADTDGFSIGESLVFTGRRFNGLVDEVTLWDHALSASDISTIYSSTTRTSVPEPASLAVLGIGGMMLLRRKRRTIK